MTSPDQLKKCWQCGHDVYVALNLCTRCKAKLGPRKPDGVSRSPEEMKKISKQGCAFLIMMGSFLGFLVYGAYWLSTRDQDKSSSSAQAQPTITTPSTPTPVESQPQSWQARYDAASDNKAKIDVLFEIATQHILIDTDADLKLNKLENNQKKARAFLVDWLTKASLETYQQGDNLTEAVNITHRLHETVGTEEPGFFDRLSLKEKAARMRIAAREAQEDIKTLQSIKIK